MPSYVRGRRSRLLNDEQIVALYVGGLDSETVGGRAGCSGSTVLAIVRAAGGTVRRTGGQRKWTLQIPKSEVVTRYLDGRSGPEIARAAGCTPSAVYHILRLAGVQLRDSVAAGKLAERVRARRYRSDQALLGREDAANG